MKNLLWTFAAALALHAFLLTTFPINAAAPALTMQDVARAAAQLGLTPGKVAQLPNGSYRLNNVAIEQRGPKTFAIIFDADPL